MAVMQKIIKKMENDFDALAQEPEKIKQLYGNISKAERSALEIIEKKASYYIEMTSRDDHAILIEKLRKFIDEKRSLWQRLMSYCDRRKARYLIIRLSKSKNETKQEYTNEAAAFLHSKKLPK